MESIRALLYLPLYHLHRLHGIFKEDYTKAKEKANYH